MTLVFLAANLRFHDSLIASFDWGLRSPLAQFSPGGCVSVASSKKSCNFGDEIENMCSDNGRQCCRLSNQKTLSAHAKPV